MFNSEINRFIVLCLRLSHPKTETFPCRNELHRYMLLLIFFPNLSKNLSQFDNSTISQPGNEICDISGLEPHAQPGCYIFTVTILRTFRYRFFTLFPL